MNKRQQIRDSYRGAPTRAGRIILFFFGLPFVLGGVLMVGGAILANEREWLALLLGGCAFLIVGLFVWRPAFPHAVNRAQDAKNPLIRWGAQNGGRFGFILLVLIMCGTPMLMAVGIIPPREADLPVPLWVSVVAAGIFLVTGLYILLRQPMQRLEPGLRKQISGLFPLLIVTGMAVVADWVAFGPGERAFGVSGSSGVLGIRMAGSEMIGRIVFGASGISLSVITLIGWYRYLRRDW